MLLNSLVDVIETLRVRIRDHGSTLEGNKVRTRMVLINPVLMALGWDSSDPSVVILEHAVDTDRVDYALLGPDGKPVVVIEAKGLSEAFTSRNLKQMVTIAGMAGVRFAALTNGGTWELYDLHASGEIQDRRIVRANLSGNRPAHQMALELLVLWNLNIANKKPVKPVSLVIKPRPPIVRTKPPKGWISLAELDVTIIDGKPTALRFPDNGIKEINYWKDFLVFSADWLVRTGKISTGNLPVLYSKSKYLMNSRPVHLDGGNFRAPRQTDTGNFYVETNFDRLDCITKTKGLFKKFGIDPTLVAVRLPEQSRALHGQELSMDEA